MSEKARQQLSEIVVEGEAREFENLRAELVEKMGVTNDSAYRYLMQHCEVEGRGSSKQVVGMKDPNAKKQQAKKAAAAGSSQAQVDPVYHEAEVMELPTLGESAAEPTSKKFRNLPILKKTDHPLIREEPMYIERRIGEATDVDKTTWAMNHPDYGTLLIGETSTGKGKLVKYICAKTYRPMVRLNFGVRITKEKLIGHYAPDGNGGFHWVDGMLTRAVRHGWVFLADEINAASPEATVALNGLLEDRDNRTLEIEELGEVIKPHSEFQIVGTMNPEYVGTQPLNPAFKSRFIPIRIPYLADDAEEKLISARTDLGDDDVERLVKIANDLRDLYPQKVHTPIGTRDLLKIADMAQIVSFEDAMNTVLDGMMGEEDRQAAMKALKLATKDGN